MRGIVNPELTMLILSYVLSRQIAMYIARQVTGASLEEIGREFGNRHHTTTLHSIRKIEAMRCTDEALNHTITRLTNSVDWHSASK
jgi:chromosomal replication initiator protein